MKEPVAAGAPAPAAGDDVRTFHLGAYLKRERQLRGLEVSDIERITRLPRRSLLRLEAGVYDGPPDGFTKGFVRAVCEALGVDAETTIARMLAEAKPERERRLVALAPGLLVIVLGLLLAGLAVGLVLSLAPGQGDPGEAADTLPQRQDHVRDLLEPP